jgi:hypothetical protein
MNFALCCGAQQAVVSVLSAALQLAHTAASDTNDWLVLLNDQSYLLPTNLYCYLRTYSAETPHLIGAGLLVGDTPFVSMAAGAAFSRAMLTAYAAHDCRAEGAWEQANYAVVFGKCIKKMGYPITVRS